MLRPAPSGHGYVTSMDSRFLLDQTTPDLQVLSVFMVSTMCASNCCVEMSLESLAVVSVYPVLPAWTARLPDVMC